MGEALLGLTRVEKAQAGAGECIELEGVGERMGAAKGETRVLSEAGRVLGVAAAEAAGKEEAVEVEAGGGAVATEVEGGKDAG